MVKSCSKLLKNNRGFTLVELLSSLTIFSFFSIALLTFMNSAASLQGTVNSSVSLETTAQTAMGVIEEYIVDASASVYIDGDEIYIINNRDYDYDDDTADYLCVIHKFYRDDSDESEVYYQKGYVTGRNTYSSITTYYRHIGVEDSTNGYAIYKKVVQTEKNESRSSSTNYTSVLPDIAPVYARYTGSDIDASDFTSSKFDAITDEDLENSTAWTTVTSIPSEAVTGTVTNYDVEIKSYVTDISSEYNGLTYSGSPELLCKNVIAFDADYVEVDGKIQQVEFSFGIENTRSEYVKTNYIVLRNTPPICTTLG